MNDVGIFCSSTLFLAATSQPVFTWLYHAPDGELGVEATVGKKVLVWSSRTWRTARQLLACRRRGTSQRSSPTWCLRLSDTSWRVHGEKQAAARQLGMPGAAAKQLRKCVEAADLVRIVLGYPITGAIASRIDCRLASPALMIGATRHCLFLSDS